MKQHVLPFAVDDCLFEGKRGDKRRKTEKEYIADRYAEYSKKIADKRQEIKEIEGGDDSAKIKVLRVKVKRTEIQIVEHELQIARLRDDNIKNKKELRDARQ